MLTFDLRQLTRKCNVKLIVVRIICNTFANLDVVCMSKNVVFFDDQIFSFLHFVVNYNNLAFHYLQTNITYRTRVIKYFHIYQGFMLSETSDNSSAEWWFYLIILQIVTRIQNRLHFGSNLLAW